MQIGSPDWLDQSILNALDRQWARKGKWLSAFDLQCYFASQKHLVTFDIVSERLYSLYLRGVVEAAYARNGKGPNAGHVLRYSRVRARW